MGPGKSLQVINSVRCLLHGHYTHGKPLGSHLVGFTSTTSTGVENTVTEKLAMVASTVSSKMVQQIARQEGFTFVECLTGNGSPLISPFEYRHEMQGFKYIGNTALGLVAQGFEVGYRLLSCGRVNFETLIGGLNCNRFLLVTRKPLDSCSGRRSEIKMALQQL